LKAAGIRLNLAGLALLAALAPGPPAVVRLNDRKRIEWAGKPVTLAPRVGPRSLGLGMSLDHQGARLAPAAACRRALSRGRKRLP